jgi:ABC-2 family transporter protein
MIGHIFKKDWKLMWKPAAVVVALQLAYAFIQTTSEFGKGNLVLEEFHTMLMYLWLIAGMMWVVMLVQQDALPGTKQDWLTRPIRRMEVLLAKVLFAALVLQGSTIAGDLIQGLGDGFSLGESLRAALLRASVGFITITLPALAIGVLTPSIAEAMIMTAVLGCGVFVFYVIATVVGGGSQHQFDPTNNSGIEWIPNLLRYVIILLGGAAVLVVGYLRKTFHGRIAMVAVLLTVLCSQAIPWKPVFALEKRLSPQGGSAEGIALSWHPHPARTEESVTGDRFDFVGIKLESPNPREEVRLLFPISVTGLPTDSVLKTDLAHVVFSQPNGKQFFSTDGGSVEIRREGAESGPATYDQAAKMPVRVYQENKDRPVQAKLAYSMTIFKLHTSYSMPAVGGDRLMTGWGHCESKINGTDTAVEVLCVQVGKGPTCATVFLEDKRDGSRNQPSTRCLPNYSPYIDRPIPDAISHFRLVLPFRDLTGQMQYAVDGSKIEDAQVVIRVYEPADHFTRVVTPPLAAMKDFAR